jgi:7,8-dihydropterin-6-yl-methyl-4-(beta-D-ribofuranosyl)aminobenzene 5'-phosphate synthase
MSTKEKAECKPKEVDMVEVISLADNSADFLSATDKKQVQSFKEWTFERYGSDWTKTHTDMPVAEHGFSLLVRVFKDGKAHRILFDTGVSPKGVVENAKRLGLDLKEVETVVLSHGHYDHFGGLEAVVKAIGKEDLLIIAHEDAFAKRGIGLSNGTVRKYRDAPTTGQLSPARILTTRTPSLLADDLVCVTGEIPRKTSFEQGDPREVTLVDDVWQPDPLIRDDRALAVNVKGKGMVVLSGCAHAGIINTVTYSKEITGVAEVYAVIGGFHLAGRSNADRIEPTIAELKRINPWLVAPSHCTGWKAMFAIARALPEAFVWNSVGNLYKL